MTLIWAVFDKITTILQYWFFLGGTLLFVVVTLFFWDYSAADFFLWLGFHFVMVTGLSVAYHRYFAHRTFDANRFVQFLLGLWGTLCLQRGPMWWTSLHRLHHRFCGTEGDPHTPSKGFFVSHLGWLNIPENRKIQWKYVQDLAKYPELRILEYAYLILIPSISAVCYWCGGLPAVMAYQVAITTSMNTIACVNSVCHERDEKDCAARNVGWVALMGAGEGFHANHHIHPGSAYFGNKWYHFDLSFLLIRMMGALGIVSNIRITVDSEEKQPLRTE